jgi:hypothetical protein
MDDRDLHMEALRFDSNNSTYFNNLGCTLTDSEVITIPDGRLFTKKELYIEALKLDGHNTRAMANLRGMMQSGEKIVLPDGTEIVKP